MAFSIVIPSRNAANLVACIRAIRQAGETARIILVDDLPYPLPDGFTWQESGLDLSRDLVVTGTDPFCFARNINIGIRAAGDDDVIVLNDDALLKTRMGFSRMYDSVMAYKDIGIVSSSCNNVGNVNQYKRSEALLRPEPRMVCMIAALIKRSTIEAVGLLDERFGSGGFEDDDMCLRTRRAGLKIGIFDGCFVDHASLPSTFRAPGGPGYNPQGAEIFREKWGAGNHDL